MTCYRFLGKRGRTTIPLGIRERLELKDHDLLSFTLEDDAIIIHRESICSTCTAVEEEPESIDDLFDRLTPAQQRALVAHLTQRFLRRNGGLRRGRI